jgi:hypothetical protein
VIAEVEDSPDSQLTMAHLRTDGAVIQRLASQIKDGWSEALPAQLNDWFLRGASRFMLWQNYLRCTRQFGEVHHYLELLNRLMVIRLLRFAGCVQPKPEEKPALAEAGRDILALSEKLLSVAEGSLSTVGAKFATTRTNAMKGADESGAVAQASKRSTSGSVETTGDAFVLDEALQCDDSPSLRVPKMLDQNDSQADMLVIDESTFSVCWRERAPIEIGNRKEFRLFQELDGSRGRYIDFSSLAERLNGDEMSNISHIKSRLVKLLRDRQLHELAACIKTSPGHYGLFLP